MPSHSRRVRLAAFDLDGTLIRGPTICESLAEPLSAHCARLTGVAIAPGAHEAFELLGQRGIRTAIVSITWSFAVEWFARRFGADAWIGTGVQSGDIQHFWPSDKPVWLAQHAHALGIELSEVAAVGDSHGDVPMLAAVGHPFFVGADLPAEIAHAIHAPNADLREIAQRILAY
jgi:phosphoserine phosphatase